MSLCATSRAGPLRGQLRPEARPWMPVDGCRIFLSADFVLIEYKLHIEKPWWGRDVPSLKSWSMMSFETTALQPPYDEKCVPRMLRSALRSALRAARAQAPRCAADPGSIAHSASPWVPALRCIVTGRCGACHRARVRATRWHRRENAAPRPGRETHCFTLSQHDRDGLRVPRQPELITLHAQRHKQDTNTAPHRG